MMRYLRTAGQRDSVAATVVAGALLVTSVAAVFATNLAEQRASARMEASRRTVGQLDLLVTHALDAETAQRGYLLTGRREYLAPYQLAIAALPKTLQALGGGLDPDQREDFRALGPLVGRKTYELTRTVALADAGRGAEARAIVTTGDGKQLMDEIRRRAGAMTAREAPRLAAAQGHVERARHVFELVSAALLISALIAAVRLTALTAARERYAATALQAVMEASPDPLSIRDRDGVYVRSNSAAARLVGMPTLEGQTLHAVTPRDVADVSREADLKVLATGEKQEIRVALRDAATGSERLMEVQKGALRDPRGQIVGVLSVGRDITELIRAQDLQKLLLDELNHRVKNTLATIQSLAAQTFRGAEPEHRRQFEMRLSALSAAHNLLTQRAWTNAGLVELVDSSLGVLGEVGRWTARGPQADLSPKIALALAMTLHELGVNAMKHGAWSRGSGRVDVEWSVDAEAQPPRLALVWRESGGPPVSTPSGRGFGSRVIERGLASELGGMAQLRFEPAGLVCRIERPLSPAQAPLMPAPRALV